MSNFPCYLIHLFDFFFKKKLKQNHNPKKKKREFRTIVCQARLHRQSNASVYNKINIRIKGKKESK